MKAKQLPLPMAIPDTGELKPTPYKPSKRVVPTPVHILGEEVALYHDFGGPPKVLPIHKFEGPIVWVRWPLCLPDAYRMATGKPVNTGLPWCLSPEDVAFLKRRR